MRDVLYKIVGEFLIQLGQWFKTQIATPVVSPASAPPSIPTPPLTEYRQKLKNLWDTCVVDQTHTSEIVQAAATILSNKTRYETVSSQVNNVPWYVIGLAHMRESNFSFSAHLANGDPLFDAQGNGLKTVQVPQGLGPFKTWEEGAIAAIKHMMWDDKSYHWDLINSLENLETWNGPGYKNLGLNTPFLWSMTNQYTKGKYVADHVYDPNAVDKQIGCVPVLLALKAQGVELNYV